MGRTFLSWCSHAVLSDANDNSSSRVCPMTAKVADRCCPASHDPFLSVESRPDYPSTIEHAEQNSRPGMAPGHTHDCRLRASVEIRAAIPGYTSHHRRLHHLCAVVGSSLVRRHRRLATTVVLGESSIPLGSVCVVKLVRVFIPRGAAMMALASQRRRRENLSSHHQLKAGFSAAC